MQREGDFGDWKGRKPGNYHAQPAAFLITLPSPPAQIFNKVMETNTGEATDGERERTSH